MEHGPAMTASRPSSPLMMSATARRPARVVATDTAESGRTVATASGVTTMLRPAIRVFTSPVRSTGAASSRPSSRRTSGSSSAWVASICAFTRRLHLEQEAGDARGQLQRPIGRLSCRARPSWALLSRLGARSRPAAPRRAPLSPPAWRRDRPPRARAVRTGTTRDGGRGCAGSRGRTTRRRPPSRRRGLSPSVTPPSPGAARCRPRCRGSATSTRCPARPATRRNRGGRWGPGRRCRRTCRAALQALIAALEHAPCTAGSRSSKPRGDQAGVAVQAQGQLGQVVGADREAVEVLEELVGQEGVATAPRTS